MTPLFFLKQRDYLRFRPQWGCFCLLNNPCAKAPNCPHCGQLCLPRCAHDTLAFSCFLAAAPKIARFFLFWRVPALAASSFPRCRSCQYEHFPPTLPHVGATSGFELPAGTRPAVPGKSDTAAARGSRGWTGVFLLRQVERFQAFSDAFLLTFFV